VVQVELFSIALLAHLVFKKLNFVLVVCLWKYQNTRWEFRSDAWEQLKWHSCSGGPCRSGCNFESKYLQMEEMLSNC